MKNKSIHSKNFIRNVVAVLALFMVGFSVTGCEKVIDLTEEENQQIAEYAAELMLKYDKKAKLKFDPDSLTTQETVQEETTTQTVEEITEATTEEVATTQEATAQNPDTPDKKPQSTTQSAGEESDSTVDATPNATETVDQAVTATVDKDFDIAAFVGEDNISVRYAYSMLVDSYPSYDQEGVYIEIQAPKGYKLLVLKFDVENKTNEAQDIDLYSRDIDYHIIVDNEKSAKQMLTILIDDLYTYQKVIDASSREEAVLLYTLSDSVCAKMKDLKLKVVYDGKDAVLQLD